MFGNLIARSVPGSRRIATVSFSGVDGAGKSTQIDRLAAHLSGAGLKIQIYRFWDDVARLTRIREGTGHRLFKGEKGIGIPGAPVNRRDKNVRGFPITCIRFFLYLLDAMSLRSVMRTALRSDADLIILDRYIYDELANLDLNRALVRSYVQVIVKMVPKPDISFVLDADPETARARKPEYPLDFIRINRQAYLNLNQVIGGITVVSAMDVEAVGREVLSHTLVALDSTDIVTAVVGPSEPNAAQSNPGLL